MNTSRGPLLGRGREADVFAWGDRQALKLFPPRWPAAVAEYEALATRVAYSSGIHTPRVNELLELDGQVGIILARVYGPSMLDVVTTQPWRLGSFARAFAELQFAVHQCAAPQLRAARRAVEGRIQNAPTLPVDLKRAALRAWAQLPDGDRLCHGDLHPDQIIVSPNGPAIIDWKEQLTAWEAPAAAARLCEELPGERERLTKLVEARLADLT